MDIYIYLVDDLNIYENNTKHLSDENTLLGKKVVELTK